MPAVIEYQDKIAKTINHKKRIDSDINCETEINLLKDIADNTNKLYKYISELDKALALSEKYTGAYESAKYMREKVFTKMQKVREVADNLELKLGKKYWPFPTYADILYSIKY